jgi:hypothetical protein
VKELAQVKAELERERTRAKIIEAALRNHERQQRASTPPKPAKPPLPPDEVRERQIKSLKTRVRNLVWELHASQEWHKRKADGSMSFQTMSAVAKCLHPESRQHVTEADKDKALKLFTAWKADNKASRT